MYHKNSQKRIYLDNAIYFVTTKTQDSFPYFENPKLARLFIHRLLIAQKQKEFRLYGYVVIPDHIHLLIQPCGEYNVSQIMFTIKKQYSHEANRLIGINQKVPTNVGEQALVRLRRYVNTNSVECKVFRWQKSYHDHIIRDQDDFNAYMEYLKYNPIKHGLIKEGELYPYLFLERNPPGC